MAAYRGPMAATTRERILDAALRAFATRGVEATPITDLEAAAGLAAGSGGFYRYFKTKDEVLAAVVRREMDRVEAEQATTEADGTRAERSDPAAPTGPADPAEALQAEFADALRRLRSLGPLMAILTREQGRIPDLAAEVADRMIDGGLRSDAQHLAPLLDPGSGVDPHETGAVVLSALVGYTLSSGYFGAPPGGVGPDRFAAALASLLHPLPTKEGSL